MKLRQLIALTVSLCCGMANGAETAYVIDKLLVGVHQEQDLNSAIIKVLPTGAPLEVIERDGELALVKDVDGNTGWVDGAYLMKDPPARVALERLQKENDELAARLKKAADGADASEGDGAPAVSNAEIDALAKDNTDLKGKLSAELLKVGELQSEIAALRAASDKTTQPDDLRIEALEQSNRALNRQLEASRQEVKALAANLKSNNGMASLALLAGGIPKYTYAIVGVLVLLAFGTGIYLMDYYNRRRHGGFRV